MNFFSRNEMLWGKEKQEILKNCKISIFGLGGLGCSVLQVLIRAGVQNFHLYDNGKINDSDIGRQLLYDSQDIGKLKTETAFAKLSQINPDCQIYCHLQDINKTSEIHSSDCFVDCVDGFATKKQIQKLVGKQNFLVHGAVEKKYGQVATFHGESDFLSLDELYKRKDDNAISRAICPQSVMFIGSLIADEVINVVWRKPKLLNKILLADLGNYEMRVVGE